MPSDVLAVALGDASPLAGLLVDAVADPGGLAVGVDHHHVGDVDGGFLRDDPARLRTALVGRDRGVLLDPVDALDEHLVTGRIGLNHFAFGALVLTRDDEDGVALVHLHLQHLRGQRDDLHEALFPKFAADRPEDAGSTRVVVRLDDHGRVLVEPDVAAVGAAALLDGANDDGLDHLTPLDVATGDGVLDGRHNDVADAGVTPARAAEYTDAQDLLGTGVVGHLQPRFLLNHSISLTWFTYARPRVDGPED